MFMDEREALPKNTELLMENGEKIILDDVVGKGASSIVYHAWRLDCMGEKHKARVKECFPAYVSVERQGNEVVPASGSEDEFLKAKDSFRSAYNRSVTIRNTPGLTNLTADAYELYEKNGILYTVVSYDEGQTYEKQADNTLKDVFEHMKAVVVAIKKYHENGYLHLDIKPENVLVIPETKEHVILFDFDSVVTFEEVKKKSGLSYTKGFSAPEQVYGWTDRIGTESDIFSLGAMTFFKLFGRVPVLEDYSLGGEIDFSKMLFWDERYPPGLKKELSYLFQNSLTVSTITRWSNVDEMIRCLDKLITLSDLTRVYLKCCEFNYSGEYFVGRRKELRELEEAMEQDGCRLVFVSGIGGIGKTELVRYYADLNRDKYDTIAFLDFKDSLEETICSDELFVHNLERGEQEETLMYYRRKLKVLRESKNALVIIDNYDISRNKRDDETMKELANCGCKFLFTTREDYKGSRYKQIDVGVMEQEEDLLELFKLHRKREYDSEEWEAVRELCKQVDYHTMAVEVFAKHLGASTEKPSDVLCRLKEKGGITNFDEVIVVQEKDGRWCEQSVLRHFLVMFDVLKLSETEKEVLKSLALLGAVRIRRDIFFKLCSEEGKSCSADVINPVNSLRRRGWIQEDASEKLSLHSIILDLGRSYLKPTSKDCPHIVNGMISYLKEELPNETECKIREQLTKSFMEGMIGNDLSYVKLCLLYKKPEYLERARELCLQLQNEDREALDLLQKLCRVEMMLACETYSREEQIIVERLRKGLRYIKEAEQYAWKYSAEPEYLGVFYVELGTELKEFISCPNIPTEGEEVAGWKGRFYQRIKEYYEYGGDFIMASALPHDTKRLLLSVIQDFYSPQDCLLEEYLWTDYVDPQKVAYYQRYLDGLERIGEDTKEAYYYTVAGVAIGGYRPTIGYVELAEMKEEKGDYVEAIELYQQAITEGARYEFCMKKIAELYSKIGDMRQAEKSLASLFDYEKKEWSPIVCCSCNRLIHLLCSENRRDEAKRYAEAWVKAMLQEQQSKEVIRWLLVGCFHLYGLETDPEKKEKFWTECIGYYDMLGADEAIGEQMLPFIMEYTSRMEGDIVKLKYGLVIFGRMETGLYYDVENFSTENKTTFINFLLEAVRINKDTWVLVVRVLICYSEHLMDHCEFDTAPEYISKAKEIYESFGTEDSYCRTLIYRAIDKCRLYGRMREVVSREEIAEKCDYYVWAREEEKGKNQEKRIKIWKEAAFRYEGFKNYKKQELCLKECLKVFDLSRENQEEPWQVGKYLEALRDIFICYARQDKIELLNEEAREKLILFLKCFSIALRRMRSKNKYWAESVYSTLSHMGRDLLKNGVKGQGTEYMLISVICSVAKEPDSEQIYEALGEWTGEIEYITEILHQVLQGEITPEDIDVVAETYDAIKDILSEDVLYARIEKEFTLFLEKHHLARVEFKQK